VTNAFELKTGDIILISFNCYECKLIEEETHSNYSHSGVIQIKNGEVNVLQALTNVHAIKLSEFLKYKRKDTQSLILRAKESELIEGEISQNEFEKVYQEKFKGLKFDSFYSWENFDEEGREKLYCSEFVSKFIDHFMIQPTIPRPMTYNLHLEFWKKYFKGNVPEGELGNSPASFLTDNRFLILGPLHD